jgi:hypothetical protein
LNSTGDSTQDARLLVLTMQFSRLRGGAMTCRIFLWVFFLLILSGCGSTPTTTSSSARLPNISLSPAKANTGSNGFELTITGEDFVGDGVCGSCINSLVVWSTDTTTDRLSTTFVSSTELKAFVTADLLANPTSAKVTVETWVAGAGAPLSITKPAAFSVTTPPAGTPVITAVSPTNATAGSADLTLTITGSNFESYKSVAFWTTDPNNLHDHGTMLNTIFVNSTQLTVVIPAALLQSSTSTQIVVLNGDPMGMSDGFFGYPESNSVAFTVTP